jgi:hypothetical protein
MDVWCRLNQQALKINYGEKAHAHVQTSALFYSDPLLLGASIQAVVPYAATRGFASALTCLKAASGKAVQSSRSLLSELHGSAFRWYQLVTMLSMQPRHHRLPAAAPLIL